jgi:deoxycytidylate deaminase
MKILKRFEEISYALLPSTHTPEMKYRHFAFLFNKNRILTIGYNQIKSHPFIHKYGYHKDSGIHAELSTIIRAREKDYSTYNMAVLRIDRNNRLNQSCPCRYCMGVLVNVGIKEIYHTTEAGEWNRVK